MSLIVCVLGSGPLTLRSKTNTLRFRQLASSSLLKFTTEKCPKQKTLHERMKWKIVKCKRKMTSSADYELSSSTLPCPLLSFYKGSDMQLRATKLSTLTPWFHANKSRFPTATLIWWSPRCITMHQNSPIQLLMQAPFTSYIQASTHATSRTPTIRTMHACIPHIRQA